MAQAIGDPRVKLPGTVKPGEVFEIKTLIAHPMELGRRQDAQGRPIPRRIIRKFVCTADGREVFSADLDTGVAANPYFAFFCRLESSAALLFTWFDDSGDRYTLARRVEVEG